MGKMALISLYDEFCLGLRHVAGYLKGKGHDIIIIHFKRYVRQSRESLGSKEQGTTHRSFEDAYLVEVSPFGEFYMDYSIPYTQQELDLLLKVLSEGKIKYVGISVPSYHKKVAVELTRLIKKNLALPVIWGGVHPTVAPMDCFDDEGVVDFICLGEGERTIGEFIEALEEGEDISSRKIGGLWLRHNGKIVKSENRDVCQNLDELGFPLYDSDREFMIYENKIIHKEPLIDSQLYWMHKIMTSRGCPFSCSFCIYSTLRRDYEGLCKVRRRSPEHVIEELRRAKARMPQLMMVEFEDDIFTLQKPWLLEFAELYKKEIALPFWCYTYPVYVNDEYLSILKDMGIEYITMGIQSGSDRINREVFDRKTNRQTVLKAVELIAKHQIFPNYDIITNNPYETEVDRYQTLDFLTQIPGKFEFHLGKLAFFPGTTLTVRAEKEGMIGRCDEKTYEFWNALYLLARYNVADRETILKLTKDEFLRENPEVLWSALRQIATLEKENEHLKDQIRQLSRQLEKGKSAKKTNLFYVVARKLKNLFS